MNKKKISLLLAIITTLVIATSYYFMSYKPYKEAVSHFETAKQEVTNKNAKLEALLADTTKTLEAKEEALDAETFKNLENSFSKAKQELRIVPAMAEKTDEIKKQTVELQKPIDYSQSQKLLSEDLKKYKDSVLKLKQITTPPQAFIEERLKEISSITEVKSVTEENDPNKQLNKQGGYIASVYFTDKQVTASVGGSDAVAKGNDGGGNVEVYKTKEEAEKRNTYLSAFDGQALLNPGSHYVYGTIIIRTSSHLTASQQTDLTKEILDKLTELR